MNRRTIALVGFLLAAALALPAGNVAAQETHPKDGAIRSAMVAAFANAGIPANLPVSLDRSNAPILYDYWLDGGVNEICDGYQWASIEVYAAMEAVDYSAVVFGWNSSLGGRPAQVIQTSGSFECLTDPADPETAATVTGYHEEVEFVVGDRFQVRVLHNTTGVPTGTRLGSAMLAAAIAAGLDQPIEPIPFSISVSADGYDAESYDVDNDNGRAQFTLSGLIVEAGTGLPIEGAVVAVVAGSATAIAAITGPDGRYLLDVTITDPDAVGTGSRSVDFGLDLQSAAISLEVSAPGHQSATDTPFQPEEITGIGSASVSGIVRDADTGEPVAGAEVRISGTVSAGPVSTGSDGSYTITAILGGTGDLSATGWDIYLLPLPPALITVVAAADDYLPTSIDVAADAAWGRATLSGFITDRATGDPIVGALVEASGMGGGVGATTDASGYYALIVPLDPALSAEGPLTADLALEPAPVGTLTITPAESIILADGLSTTALAITLAGPDGTPLDGRTIRLAALEGGSVDPAEVVTAVDGTATAVYTSFRPDPRATASHGDALRDVTIKGTEVLNGMTGTGFVTLQQHLVTVALDRSLAPACVGCDVPVHVGITASRYDFTPLAGVTLTLRLPGSDQGVLLPSLDASPGGREITITTDGGGNAEAWYRWSGDRMVRSETATILAVEGETNGAGAADLSIEGFDLVVADIQPAGRPSDITFDQVYMKFYVKDLLHPGKSLDRFDVGATPVGLSVRATQIYSDGPLTAAPFFGPVRLGTDAKGTYVRLFTTPSLPAMTPVNDGWTTFLIRVDVVDASGRPIADAFPLNNQTTMAVDTTSPKGVVTTWLESGILTPHNYSLAAAKCVIRFLPGWGQAVDVVDTTNALLISDWFNAGRSGVVNGTDQLLDKLAKNLPDDIAKAVKSPVGIINNVSSCIEDFHRISLEGGGLFTSGAIDAIPVRQDSIQAYLAEMRWIEDRYIHGIVATLPGYRAVVVYGAGEEVRMVAGDGSEIADPLASHEDGVAVFFVPESDSHRLELGASGQVDVAVYDFGVPAGAVIRHYTAASFDGAALELPPGEAGEFVVQHAGVAESIPAVMTALDTVAPVISRVAPAAEIPAGGGVITADYVDTGSGIEPAGVRLLLDGTEITAGMDASATGVRYLWPDPSPGEHTAVLIVPDHDGNAAALRWTFTVGDGPRAAAGLLAGASGEAATALALVLRVLAGVIAAGAVALLAGGLLAGRGGRFAPYVVAAIAVLMVGASLWLGGGEEPARPIGDPDVPLAAVVVPDQPPAETEP